MCLNEKMKPYYSTRHLFWRLRYC